MIIELITALSIPVACAVGGHNIAKEYNRNIKELI